jgi:glycosyltransferase involved in cell wall biosynthesis
MLAFIHRRTAVIASSSQSRQQLHEKLGLKLENITAANPGIGEEYLNIPAVPDTERRPDIVWLGKIRKYKCPHHAIAAMPFIVRRSPEARLIIAGRAENQQFLKELKQLAAQQGVAANVIIKTNLTEAEKISLLKEAKALIVTSPIEGFGIVILEANACGLPVIVTDGVPEEAVQAGINGFRVPFNRPEALADAVNNLLDDEEAFARISAKGREFIKVFAWPVVAQKFWELVQRTVKTDA